MAKIPDIPKDTPVYAIAKVGIIGAGTMGGGIAMACANAGISVLLKEVEQAALDRGMATVRKNYENSVKKGRFTQQVMDQRMALIHPQLTYDGFDQVDMIIEAAFESMELKKRIFGEIEKIAKPDCVLASNTSTLDIDADRRRHFAPADGDRPALLQSGERHAAGGDRARGEDQQAGRGDCTRGGQEAR